MHSTPDPKQADPPNVLAARADEELAHAYAQITRADQEIARAEEQLSKLERDAARHASDHPQARMNTPRPAVRSKRLSLGARALRGFIGLMLAACIGVAAIAWQSPYGDTARQIIIGWAPQLVLTSWLPLEKPGLAAQPGPPAIQSAATTAAPPQPAPLAPTAPENVAPTVAALSPELTQLLQSMARDLATLAQAIEQLKVSQQQMGRDHVNAVDLLRVSQEQMGRVIAKTSEAKASEQSLRPKISGPPPRPTAAPMRKPTPQATARPQAE
jgi:hypothetical protein